MRKNSLQFMSALLITSIFIGVPARSFSASLSAEKPLAGIALSIDKYCNNKLISADEKNTSKQTINKQNTVQSTLTAQNTSTETNAVYDQLGVANVTNYMYVRKKPNENSKIVGTMTRNAGCRVYSIKNGWAEIVSGDVKGYVKKANLLVGKEAEERAKAVASLRITVKTKKLNVRVLPSIKSEVADTISADEEYTVGKRNITKEWLEDYINENCTKDQLENIDMKNMYSDVSNWVMLKIDDDKVFVSKDFISFTYSLNRAVKFKYVSVAQNSTSSSNTTSNKSNKNSAVNSSIASEMVDYAMQFLGNPYVWGGTSLTNGADCSGFVMRIYEHFGYSLPRTSREQAAYTKTVDESDVKVGDLFFYGSSYVSHVALYIGDGKIIHASNKKDGIKISSAYYRTPLKIGRVMN